MAEETTVSTMAAAAETSPAPTTPPVETTPSSESQATEPQEQPRTEATPETPAALSPEDRFRESLKDPEYEQVYQRRVNADGQRIANKLLKRERLTRAREDPVAALEYAQAEDQEFAAEDAQTKQTNALDETVNKNLAALCTHKAWSDEYEVLRTGPRAREVNKQYAERKPVLDKEGKITSDTFTDWADDQITESRIEQRANVKAKDMAKAMALDMTNDAMKGMPKMPTSSGGSVTGGFATQDEANRAYNNGEISREDYIKSRRANLPYK